MTVNSSGPETDDDRAPLVADDDVELSEAHLDAFDRPGAGAGVAAGTGGSERARDTSDGSRRHESILACRPITFENP